MCILLVHACSMGSAHMHPILAHTRRCVQITGLAEVCTMRQRGAHMSLCLHTHTHTLTYTQVGGFCQGARHVPA